MTQKLKGLKKTQKTQRTHCGISKDSKDSEVLESETLCRHMHWQSTDVTYFDTRASSKEEGASSESSGEEGASSEEEGASSESSGEEGAQ
jgi:hypothetical protein